MICVMGNRMQTYHFLQKVINSCLPMLINMWKICSKLPIDVWSKTDKHVWKISIQCSHDKKSFMWLNLSQIPLKLVGIKSRSSHYYDGEWMPRKSSPLTFVTQKSPSLPKPCKRSPTWDSTEFHEILLFSYKNRVTRSPTFTVGAKSEFGLSRQLRPSWVIKILICTVFQFIRTGENSIEPLLFWRPHMCKWVGCIIKLPLLYRPSP